MKTMPKHYLHCKFSQLYIIYIVNSKNYMVKKSLYHYNNNNRKYMYKFIGLKNREKILYKNINHNQFIFSYNHYKH